MLEREPGAALWRQIADAIQADIDSGRMRAGDRLDPEPVLAEHFGVNRHTVRQAVKQLAHLGYLKIERGRGTYVQGRAIDYPLGARTRFSEIMLAKGYEPSREILDVSEVPAESDEARALKTRVGAKLVRIETRSRADEETFGYSVHLFPASRLTGIGDLVRETRSITRALAQLGHGDYERAWTRVTAELPDERTAAALGRPQTRPVLRTEGLNIAADGTPLEYGYAFFAGDICRLTVAGADQY